MTTSNTSLSTINMMATSQINYGDYYKGLALALSSCVFIGTSFIVKKKGLLRVRTSGSRAGEGGYAYLKEWMWWIGLITMVVGEAANFTAYAFAPAILVTPLGAISVIVRAVLASIMLKERLNLHGKVGCFLCVIGSTVLVIHAPPEENVNDMEELSAKLRDPLFIGYTLLVLLISIFLIIYVSPKYGKTNILVYIAICSLFGSLTVSACKGLGIAIKETLAHNSQVSNPIAWMLLIGGALCIMVQMNFLNKALDIFNTSIVSPIYYVMFTTFAIIASAILYKEWAKLNAKDALGSVCGFLTIIIGVFLLHAFKDIKFSFQDLYGSVTISKNLTDGEANVLITELESDEENDSNISNNYLTSKF
ncbi:magnesium transporter NIPA2 isoform X1 [Hydra vulgaris]|uniref:Magnesium transporter NIPA2 isoform X1 n=2 Tax=Hydra vulgaris TaxID=6087 RepID=A0ABM4D6C7_HYDVU